MNKSFRFYSIVIPTYNEENDIAATVEHLLKLEWNEYEIIFVDDSNDSTRDIIKKYNSLKIKLICPETRLGRCGARNVGIKKSVGDVVIILNADVHLPADFIQSIDRHYDSGADVVMVKSRVANVEFFFPRYVDCVSEYVHYYKKQIDVRWTEGYSCKRSVALKAGLFPDGYPVKICAGEDAEFGKNIEIVSKKIVHDESIECLHICPESYSEYWNIRKGRGKGGPQVRRYIKKQNLLSIITVSFLRTVKFVVSCIFLPSYFIRSCKFLRFSNYKYKDWILFPIAMWVEDLAFVVGEIESICEILSIEKWYKYD